MCLSPITVKTTDAFGLPINQSVPCGKCIECLKDRQNSWKIRLCEESRDHLFTYFFTLTYSDDNVPFTFSDDGEKLLHFDKTHLQLWLKRHRMSYSRHFNRDVDFKYFICSEYGPNTGRPHYHGILFTEISPTYISRMFNDWSQMFGFTNFSEVGKCGKKKLEVVFPPLETTLQSIVLSHLNFGLKQKFVLTNLPKLDYYRHRFI